MAVTIKTCGSWNVGAIVHPSSVRGVIVPVNTDLETADTASLLQPQNITRAAFSWVRVPDGCSRALIFGRNSASATTFTTDPVVTIWGAFLSYPGPEAEQKVVDSAGFSGTITALNHAIFRRLDNVDAAGTGLTIDFSVSVAEDASYDYTDYESTTGLAGLDLKGAHYVGMLVSTAAQVTGGSAHEAHGMLHFIN